MFIDPERFQLSAKKPYPNVGKVQRHTEPFLAGPIPLGWLQKASLLPGRAIVVGVIAWHLQKLKKTKEIRFSFKMAKTFGLDRWAVYRGLYSLEKSGLVRVVRRKGSSPQVTLVSDLAFNPSNPCNSDGPYEGTP